MGQTRIWLHGVGLLLVVAAITGNSVQEFLPYKVPPSSHMMTRRSIDLMASNSNMKDFRLPNGIVPLSYRLTIQPFLEEARFEGRVFINVTCKEETDTVMLHAHETLTVAHSEVGVRALKKGAIPTGLREDRSRIEAVTVSSTKKDLAHQWYIITLTNNLTKGAAYEVELAFSGLLNRDRSEAFFLNSYEDHRTKGRRWFAATQMRPNNARRVFPCFDGPMYKATFELSIIRPTKMMALSNMPVRTMEKKAEMPGWEVDHFHKTPVMSTFSVAVVVSDLGYVTPLNPLTGRGGPRIRVFGRAHFLSRLQNAADVVPQVVTFIQDYLGVPYPLPELDLVVLPHYSAPNPADLWGVVIFREDDLIGESMQVQLTNEIAYQWLGHLITPIPRWSDVHINKALITFLASARLQQVSKAYDLESRVTRDHSLYYEYSKRHPYANIGSQKESVRLMKTQWLFKMLNYTLSEQTFRSSVKKLLEDKKFNAFTEDDLFSIMTERAWAAGTLAEPTLVGYIVDSWFKPDHCPVITVTRHYTNNSAHIEQHVFLRDRPHDVPNKSKLLWWIPLMYLTKNNLDVGSLRVVSWMEEQREVNLGGLPDQDSFVIFNPDEIGMFMVNYDLTNWNMLSDYLRESAAGNGSPLVDVGTRVKLLHDAWNLAYAGELHFGAALNMTLFLQYETELPVWDTMFTMIDHVGKHISGTDAGRKFSAYVCQMVAPLYESLAEPKPNEDRSRTSLRGLAKYVLCNAGYRPCVDQARAVYSRWMEMDDPDEGNPVADSYLCPVYKWGSFEEWEFGLQRLVNFPASREQEERSSLLCRLAGCPREEDRIERLLNVTLLEKNGNFTDADVRYILSVFSGSAQGYSALFNFLSQNWDSVKARCEGKPNLWEYIIDKAIMNFKTQEGLDLVSELYVSRMGQFGHGEPIIEDALRVIKEEAEWSSENLPIIEQWLDNHLNTDNAIWY